MLVVVFILAAVAMRFLPHLWNLTPVGAMLLLAGSRMKPKHLWFPFLALIASDFALTIGYYHAAPLADQYFNWAAYLLTMGLGYLALRGRLRLVTLAASSLACSTLFFLVSNFGVWAVGILYPRTLAGLGECMLLGLPFYRNAIAGDLMYSFAFFGLYAWLSQRQTARAAAAV